MNLQRLTDIESHDPLRLRENTGQACVLVKKKSEQDMGLWHGAGVIFM